jgi:hypothetical protein
MLPPHALVETVAGSLWAVAGLAMLSVAMVARKLGRSRAADHCAIIAAVVDDGGDASEQASDDCEQPDPDGEPVYVGLARVRVATNAGIRCVVCIHRTAVWDLSSNACGIMIVATLRTT